MFINRDTTSRCSKVWKDDNKCNKEENFASKKRNK